MNARLNDLRLILSTVQKTQVCISGILNTAMQTDLRQLLCQQLRELDSATVQARAIAISRGWELQQAGIVPLASVKLLTSIFLICGTGNAHTAVRMAYRSTKKIITRLQGIIGCCTADRQICALGQQLLDSAAVNIQLMQGFL